ncbi:hypothetical protein BCAR13_300126 [Paraburkholderia caribensis]|nr:hypothetical protein BCAR13_300126 [Paraburkholderia caribensis]
MFLGRLTGRVAASSVHPTRQRADNVCLNVVKRLAFPISIAALLFSVALAAVFAPDRWRCFVPAVPRF